MGGLQTNKKRLLEESHNLTTLSNAKDNVTAQPAVHSFTETCLHRSCLNSILAQIGYYSFIFGCLPYTKPKTWYTRHRTANYVLQIAPGETNTSSLSYILEIYTYNISSISEIAVSYHWTTTLAREQANSLTCLFYLNIVLPFSSTLFSLTSGAATKIFSSFLLAGRLIHSS